VVVVTHSVIQEKNMTEVGTTAVAGRKSKMGSWRRGAAVAAVLVASGSIAAPAVASQNIGWTWNSGDHDAKAKFTASGDTYTGIGYEPNSFVNWGGPSGSGRWNLGKSGNEQTLPFKWAENKTVTLNVCQKHTGFPDDCSGTKYGVS
jgi:hypothetical protein